METILKMIKDSPICGQLAKNSTNLDSHLASEVCVCACVKFFLKKKKVIKDYRDGKSVIVIAHQAAFCHTYNLEDQELSDETVK